MVYTRAFERIESPTKIGIPRRMDRPSGCRLFSSSRNQDSGGNHDRKEEEDDGGEEWIPPVRFSNSEDLDSSSDNLPKSQRIETILEVSRQVKEQERIDRALEESEQEVEALFQLSEEEQTTLTDEEILERLEKVLKREEELEEKMFQKELEEEILEQTDEYKRGGAQHIATDWQRNRRSMLGEENDASPSSASVVPITRHVLLEADEIQLLLEAHGGEDIVIVRDDPEAQRMGGADGMIFCTAGGSTKQKEQNSLQQNNTFLVTSPYLISTLSRVLIDHMKDRKLHELGIAPSSNQNTTSRASVSSPMLYGSGFTSPSESWRIVDCGNYIVHILDEATRYDLNLEDLWSGADPIWKLNTFDEDEVEDYCYKNPVPSTYNGTGSNNNNSNDTLYDEETFMDVASMKKLERTRFGTTRRHKPVIAQAAKNRDRTIGRKKRREQRERDYFGSDD